MVRMICIGCEILFYILLVVLGVLFVKEYVLTFLIHIFREFALVLQCF